MKNLSLLPSELLDLIASYVFRYTTRDYRCLHVCSSWYASFQPSLYRTIRIKHRRQLKQLMSSIQRNPEISLYVRHVYIQDQVGLSRDEMESLPLLFPLLESLYFNPKLWKYQRCLERERGDIGWSRLTSLPPLDCYNTTLPLIQSFGSSLQELVLMGGIVNPLHRMQIPQKGKSMLLGLLDLTPQLRHLTLYGRDKLNARALQDAQRAEFTVRDILRLQASLPCLDSLTLLDVALSMSTEQVPMALAAATQMRRLHVQGLLADYRWIGHVAELYPHLTDLDLDVYWDASYKQTLTWMDIGPIQACLSKVARLASLQRIHLGQIESVLKSSADSRFFDQLSKTTRTGLVSLDNTCDERNLCGKAAVSAFTSFMACTHPDVTETLKVQLWRDLGGIENPMRSIGLCTRLTELELHCGKFSYAWAYGCDIDVILDFCPQLETLCLNMARLTFKSKENIYNKGPRVKTVRLLQTHFTTEAMHVLAECCPSLEHLELIRCVKDRDALAHKIHLSLPYQHLKTLSVHHLHLRPSSYIEKSSIDAALVAVRFTDRTKHNLSRKSNQLSQRWYHLCSQKTKNGHSRQMRRLKLLESLKVQDYEMKDKDWDYLEENAIRGTYREARYWDSDIPYGYLQVDCRSIDTFVFNRVKL
ncbi:hypothetical protein V8B55DRAFT_1459227 [Mucor lusitanicus]|uniref:F-box domain-containing protein n=2 Tax=Mucor circinelloides f. lusitanicus TaxID=29924 RepID=A0A168KGH4_MUCCL|nr:hypothetical protein MUCCIDRAFT_111745 [Mucor lusitanicus CBS 277.49]